MQTPFTDFVPDRMRPAWWWSGTQLWEMLPGGRVRLYLPWGPDFGCWRWHGAAWEEDIPAAPLFDRRGTWLDPAGPRDDVWQGSCAARAAYFSGIPWALRARAAQEDDPWRFLVAEAAQIFGLRSEYPEYCVYTKREDAAGSDVFELFPGDFDGDIRWWYPGSVYVREEAFEPFAGILRRIMPEFDWYGENRLYGPQIEAFADTLDRMAEGIPAADEASTIKTGAYFLAIEAADFQRRKSRLAGMAGDLRRVAALALQRGSSLWILGV